MLSPFNKKSFYGCTVYNEKNLSLMNVTFLSCKNVILTKLPLFVYILTSALFIRPTGKIKVEISLYFFFLQNKHVIFFTFSNSIGCYIETSKSKYYMWMRKCAKLKNFSASHECLKLGKNFTNQSSLIHIVQITSG